MREALNANHELLSHVMTTTSAETIEVLQAAVAQQAEMIQNLQDTKQSIEAKSREQATTTRNLHETMQALQQQIRDIESELPEDGEALPEEEGEAAVEANAEAAPARRAPSRDPTLRARLRTLQLGGRSTAHPEIAAEGNAQARAALQIEIQQKQLQKAELYKDHVDGAPERRTLQKRLREAEQVESAKQRKLKQAAEMERKA